MPTTTPAPVAGHAADLAEFASSEFGRRTIAETDRLRAVVVAFEPGQEIPLHAPSLDLVATIVEGTGEVFAGDRVHHVRAGDVVFVPAGETRGMRATGGRMIAVNVVSPPPGPDSHARSAASWPVEETGPDVAALILEEHGGLFPHLEHLGQVAAAARELPEAELRERLRSILDFLVNGLLPHAHEEERSVYPAAERVIRAVGGATRTMSIDHRFVGELVDDLERVVGGSLDAAERERATRLLYGLQTLLEVHFTKENEAYVPLLSRLSPAERRELYEHLSGSDHGHSHHHKEG